MNIKLVLLGSIALLLSACVPSTVRVSGGVSTGDVVIRERSNNYISSFTPTGGEGVVTRGRANTEGSTTGTRRVGLISHRDASGAGS